MNIMDNLKSLIAKYNFGPIMLALGIVGFIASGTSGLARGYAFGSVGLALAGIVMATACAGCASQPSLCYQAVSAADTAVMSTGPLLQSGMISQSSARTVYADAILVRAGLGSWWAGIQAGTATGDSVPVSINAALATLLSDLSKIQQTSPVRSARPMRSVKLQSPAKVSATPILPILELVVQLLPPIEGEIQALLNKQTVTADQMNAALAKLDSDLATLNTALGPVPMSLFKGTP